MSAPKHSPAPWRYDHTDYRYEYDIDCEPVSDDAPDRFDERESFECIAAGDRVVMVAQDGSSYRASFDWRGPEEQRAANKALVLAAPALYAALENAVEAMRANGWAEQGDSLESRVNLAVFRRARAALAQARGEEASHG